MPRAFSVPSNSGRRCLSLTAFRQPRLQVRGVPVCALRRELLAALVLAYDVDPATVANSVLSAYGLPLLPKTKGFKELDDFSLDCQLQYPKSWVVRCGPTLHQQPPSKAWPGRPRITITHARTPAAARSAASTISARRVHACTLDHDSPLPERRKHRERPGVYISDFQTADKAVVEDFALPAGLSVVEAAVRAAVSPTTVDLKGTDKLALPADSAVKVERREIDGLPYTYLAFPSDTLTNSGYNVRRKNLVAAVEKKGRVLMVVASARSDQFTADKAETLTYIVQSFRAR